MHVNFGAAHILPGVSDLMSIQYDNGSQKLEYMAFYFVLSKCESDLYGSSGLTCQCMQTLYCVL